MLPAAWSGGRLGVPSRLTNNLAVLEQPVKLTKLLNKCAVGWNGSRGRPQGMISPAEQNRYHGAKRVLRNLYGRPCNPLSASCVRNDNIEASQHGTAKWNRP